MRHTRSQSRSWADNAIVGYWPLPTTRHLTKPRCSAPAAEFRARRRRQCSVCALPPHRFARAGVEPALRSGSHPRPNGLADGSAWKSGREYITQPQPSSGSASCSWCERRFQTRQSGGHAHPVPFRILLGSTGRVANPTSRGYGFCSMRSISLTLTPYTSAAW